MFGLHSQQLQSNKSKFLIKKCTNTSLGAPSIENHEQKFSGDGRSERELLSEKPSDNGSPPLSATVSLVKKYARAVFMRSPEKAGAKSERNVESKTSTKWWGASAGEDDGSKKLNSFSKMAKNRKRGSTSKLECVEDTPGISGKVRSNARKTTVRKETMAAMYTDVTPNLPPLDRNGVSIPEIEHKNSADKIRAQVKEVVPNDPEIGTNMLVNGRKRHNDSFSDEQDGGHNQKHQKKARQNGSDAVEEESPACILDNGRSHDSENASLVGNATLLPSTCYHGMLKTQEQETGRGFLEAGEPANKIASPSTNLTDSDYNEGDGYNHVINEEVDAEEESDDEVEEIKASRLQKIWFFLTT